MQYASNGEETIALYKKAQESQRAFDVVILDLAIQGGMGGKEAMAQLLSIDTHVKAIVASGYVHDPVVLEYEKHGFRGDISNSAIQFRVNSLSVSYYTPFSVR